MKFQSLKDKLHKFFSGVLEVLFPSKIKCMFCGREIFDYEKQPYCDSCAKSAPFNNAKRCKICDCEMYDDGEICDGCKDYTKHFDKAVFAENARKMFLAKRETVFHAKHEKNFHIRESLCCLETF